MRTQLHCVHYVESFIQVIDRFIEKIRDCAEKIDGDSMEKRTFKYGDNSKSESVLKNRLFVVESNFMYTYMYSSDFSPKRKNHEYHGKNIFSTLRINCFAAQGCTALVFNLLFTLSLFSLNFYTFFAFISVSFFSSLSSTIFFQLSIFVVFSLTSQIFLVIYEIALLKT